MLQALGFKDLSIQFINTFWTLDKDKVRQGFWYLIEMGTWVINSMHETCIILFKSHCIQKGSVIQIQEIVVVLTQNISAPTRNLVHLIVFAWRWVGDWQLHIRSWNILSQGRNQVCTQRWTRLENFPPNCFFPVEISILVHPKQISVVSKSGGKKKSSAHFHTFPLPF